MRRQIKYEFAVPHNHPSYGTDTRHMRSVGDWSFMLSHEVHKVNALYVTHMCPRVPSSKLRDEVERSYVS
jgi:hypothetical protein